ncbi:MAG: response regulator [Candidatus Obscuribacterales bacterium]|nr:response regulator [Candidatus Obscuribacterales bacterium]
MKQKQRVSPKCRRKIAILGVFSLASTYSLAFREDLAKADPPVNIQVSAGLANGHGLGAVLNGIGNGPAYSAGHGSGNQNPAALLGAANSSLHSLGAGINNGIGSGIGNASTNIQSFSNNAANINLNGLSVGGNAFGHATHALLPGGSKPEALGTANKDLKNLSSRNFERTIRQSENLKPFQQATPTTISNQISRIYFANSANQVRGLESLEAPKIALNLAARSTLQFTHPGANASLEELASGKLRLDKGTLFLNIPAAKHACLIETPLGKIWIGKQADVFISMENGLLRVQNLDSLSNGVRFISAKADDGGKQIAIAAGFELVLSDKALKAEQLNPADGIARRSPTLIGNSNMAVSEINLATALQAASIKEAIGAKQSNDNKLQSRLMKTAVVLDMVRGSSGFVTNSNASAVATLAHELHPLGQVVKDLTPRPFDTLIPAHPTPPPVPPPVTPPGPPVLPPPGTVADSIVSSGDLVAVGVTDFQSAGTQSKALTTAVSAAPIQYFESTKAKGPSQIPEKQKRNYKKQNSKKENEQAAKFLAQNGKGTSRAKDETPALQVAAPFEFDYKKRKTQNKSDESTAHRSKSLYRSRFADSSGGTLQGLYEQGTNGSNSNFDNDDESSAANSRNAKPVSRALSIVKRGVRRFPELVIAGLAIIASLLIISLLLARAAFMRARQLEHLNKKLAAEIQERRLIEKKAQNLNDDLEKRLSQLDHLNKELAAARDQALEGSRLKSEFVANISHEIRTPISAVIGMNTLLLNTELNPTQQEYARMANESAQSLLTVINDILDFSKMEAGKLEINSTGFSPNSIVREVCDILAPLIKEKGLLLNTNLEANIPDNFKGDPSRLRQVLLNLAGNAIKFTKEGEIKISTEFVKENEESAHIKFSVSDTGIGIPASAQAKLFMPFVQADGSTTRRYGGTGLGLSISKRLVELMGGQIKLESEEGKGSTFSFELPCFTSNESKENQNQLSSSKSQTLNAVALNKTARAANRILVAEDSPVLQNLVKQLLKKLGYTPDLVSNGKLALAASKSKNYDLILMDWQMPEMDGLEAAEAIRIEEEKTGIHTPIVAMTANAMQGDRDRCISAGMDGYLSKPFKLEELQAIIEQFIANDDDN